MKAIKNMSDKEFYAYVNEAKKDPQFMKEIDRFIKITTGKPYKLK